MFDQFKEKIHSVQQDLNAGLKTLSEKAREVGRSKKLPGELHVLENKQAVLSALKPESIDAGEEILHRFQQSWTQIHVNIEYCSEQATKVDKLIQEVSEEHERQSQAWKQLQARVQDIPDMAKQIQILAVALGNLEATFEEIEEMLNVLEDTSEEEELLRNKRTQVVELTRYREQKEKERRLRRDRLQDEYDQKFRRVEEKEDAKKKERQKAFQEVFAADMAHYRTHGKPSNVVTQSPVDQESKLDEFEISLNADDQQALDDFLGPDETLGAPPKRDRKEEEEMSRGEGDDDEEEDDDDDEAVEEDDKTSADTSTVTETEEELRIDVTESQASRPNDEEQAADTNRAETHGDAAKEDAQGREGEHKQEKREEENEERENEEEEEEEEEDFGTPDEDALDEAEGSPRH